MYYYIRLSANVNRVFDKRWNFCHSVFMWACLRRSVIALKAVSITCSPSALAWAWIRMSIRCELSGRRFFCWKQTNPCSPLRWMWAFRTLQNRWLSQYMGANGIFFRPAASRSLEIAPLFLRFLSLAGEKNLLVIVITSFKHRLLNYFARVFHQLIGIQPTEFRRRYR